MTPGLYLLTTFALAGIWNTALGALVVGAAIWAGGQPNPRHAGHMAKSSNGRTPT